jgi:hypothetical protein
MRQFFATDATELRPQLRSKSLPTECISPRLPHISPVPVKEGPPSTFLGGAQMTSLRELGSLAVSSSTPFSVTSIVCSNCAERLPSWLYRIQH